MRACRDIVCCRPSFQRRQPVRRGARPPICIATQCRCRRCQPHRGLAVVHSPTRVSDDGSFLSDKRCLHESRPAVDEKWLLATWVWATPVADEWGDESIPPLGPDRV